MCPDRPPSAAGKLATVTDPSGSVLSHSYDLRGREIGQNDPDSGKTSYSYNDLDQLVSTTDARGKKIVYSYDGLDRKTTERSDSATGELRKRIQDGRIDPTTPIRIDVLG